MSLITAMAATAEAPWLVASLSASRTLSDSTDKVVTGTPSSYPAKVR